VREGIALTLGLLQSQDPLPLGRQGTPAQTGPDRGSSSGTGRMGALQRREQRVKSTLVDGSAEGCVERPFRSYGYVRRPRL
jgi:hypothetical protein